MEKASEFKKKNLLLHWLKSLTMWITTNYGKFVKRQEYLACLLGNPFGVKKQQLESDMEQQTGSKLFPKLVPNCYTPQGCILSPCLFNLYAEYSKWNARLGESQAGIKISGRNVNNFRYADYTTLMVKVKRNQRGCWWEWRRRVKKLA